MLIDKLLLVPQGFKLFFAALFFAHAAVVKKRFTFHA
jgi:hypothetical protein